MDHPQANQNCVSEGEKTETGKGIMDSHFMKPMHDKWSVVPPLSLPINLFCIHTYIKCPLCAKLVPGMGILK